MSVYAQKLSGLVILALINGLLPPGSIYSCYKVFLMNIWFTYISTMQNIKQLINTSKSNTSNYFYLRHIDKNQKYLSTR